MSSSKEYILANSRAAKLRTFATRFFKGSVYMIDQGNVVHIDTRCLALSDKCHVDRICTRQH